MKWASKKLLDKLRGGDLLDSQDHQEFKNITGRYLNEIGNPILP